ncbi:MAG: trigger factor [Alicyclobacillus macrosporangiidus]|uniref:trigger factor n=1 Tax=Alicyclobacillus macrosporangiidus TaxID=392015 RepID=UPI0026E952DD|nr:trigger factor [Alicyclobacillus macrosporangiidus]MCL6599746.1 trigger factor [Alicyclobacillus macrosporangiidus]
MTVKWEKTQTNVGVLEVEVPSDRFAEALDVAFKKVVKRVVVPGFRKGKVPRKLFEARFGVESLYQDAVEYLLPRAYADAVEETGIEPVAQPEIDVIQVEAGKPFVFKATVTVKPEVELGQYKGLEIQDKPFPADEAAVQEELDNIRKLHAEINPVEDGEVQEGDTVHIDFFGTVDGEPFEGGEAENFQLEIGSGMFIKGFEEQLIGMKPGDEREIEVKFPDDYHIKSLAGKQAKFKVKLHDIKRKFLREVNDEFVQEISEFQTVDEFMEDLRKQVAARKEAEHRRYLEEQVVQAAVAQAKVEIPQVMIDHEAEHLLQHFAQQLAMQQIPLDAYLEFSGMTREELRDQFRDTAEKNVRTSLVLEAIAKAEGLTVSDDEIEAELSRIAEGAGLPLERVKELYALRDPGFAGMRSELQTRKTVGFLVENSKVA